MYLRKKTKYGVSALTGTLGLLAMLQTPINESYKWFSNGLDPRIEKVKKLYLNPELLEKNRNYSGLKRDSLLMKDFRTYCDRRNLSYNLFILGFMLVSSTGILINLKHKPLEERV